MANSKVRWGGTTEDGRTTSTIWGNNSFTWGDVTLAAEIAEIISDDGVASRCWKRIGGAYKSGSDHDLYRYWSADRCGV